MRADCQRWVLGLLTGLLAALPMGAQEVNRNIRFGKPVAEKAFSDSKLEDFVIARPTYVMSFNGKKNTPNWVSWNLLRSDIGNVSRGSFEPDPALPRNFAFVTHATYIGTGFDRGHMCPSKDRSDTEAHNDTVFYMSNMIPQAPNNNQNGWERLETYCRDLAKKGHDLHIVCGPQGVGGEGKNGSMDAINKGRIHITVPAKTWKVILVLPRPKAMPDKRTRTIAVIMPNNQSVVDDWSKYRVSVREVEKLTGYRFFPNLPPELAGIKEVVDSERIVIPPRPMFKN